MPARRPNFLDPRTSAVMPARRISILDTVERSNVVERTFDEKAMPARRLGILDGEQDMRNARKEPSMTLQDHRDSFSKYLRAALGRRGLMGVQLAEAAGLPAGYVRRLLTAQANPSHRAREKIAKALGIDVVVMEDWFAR